MAGRSSLEVALISIHYPPIRTSTAVQMQDLAEEFVAQGHRATVLVPDSEINVPCVRESERGVEILRLKAPSARVYSLARRAINETLLSFFLIRAYRNSELRNKEWDLIVWYSPTIFFSPFVWYLSFKSKAYRYLILRDMFPQWALDTGILRPGIAYLYFKFAADIQYWLADCIGVQSESNLPYVQRWSRQNRRHVEVLNNWLRIRPLGECSIALALTPLARKHIFVYAGNMGFAQGAAILVDLAASLKDRSDIGFVFVGRGADFSKLQLRAKVSNLDNTMFFDEIPSEEIPGLLSQCRGGLFSLNLSHKSHNVPGKFLSYMSAGLPVIANVNRDTDVMKMINEQQVGRAFSTNQIAPMREFVLELCDNDELHAQMSINARALAESQFSVHSAVGQILSHLARS